MQRGVCTHWDRLIETVVVWPRNGALDMRVCGANRLPFLGPDLMWRDFNDTNQATCLATRAARAGLNVSLYRR